jgi:hypothetical protein
MTGIIVMMMMRARTEIREIRRAGENLLVGNGKRIAMAGPSSWGLAGALPAASRLSQSSKHHNG